MSRFGFVGPSYRSQSVLADCQTCMNWYLEQIESGMGRSAYALYQTPGLSLLYQIGAAGVRGVTTIQGRTFAVAGASLWELLAPNLETNTKNWSAALAVPLPSDGNPALMVGGGHQLLIVSSGQAFVFDLNLNTLTAVDPSGGAHLPVASIAFADSFFFALVQNNAPVPWQINSSNSFDATTWQATNFAEVEVFSDNPNCIFAAQRLLWVFGPKGIQPYSNTGDFPFPFDVIPGTYIENGLAAPASVVKLDNSIFWLGSDERGNGMVWRMNGFTPQRVSNHAIEFALQSYPTIADAVAYSYQDQGHSFYVLSLPKADKTWVYDVATQQWHERGFRNAGDGKLHRHRAAFLTFNFGMHLVGDYSTGAVYQQAIDIYSDFGNPICRLRRAPHISKEQKRIRHAQLQVDVEVGIQTIAAELPSTLFTVADANGKTYSVGVTDQGAFSVTPGAADVGAPLYLNDPATSTSWQIFVSTQTEQLYPVSIPYDDSLPAALQMVSNTGKSLWTAIIRQIAGNVAQLGSNPLGLCGRGPLWTLRYSNDGAKTFLAREPKEGGKIGEFLRRVIWRQLGTPRDRVYELEFSEACPARVIDAYLDAEGYEPVDRLNQELAKRA